MNLSVITAVWRDRVHANKRLPLNVRSAGHALIASDWRHPAGVVDRYNLYWGVAGEIHYTVDDKSYCTRPRELLIFPLDSRMGPADRESAGEYRWFTLDGRVAEPLFKELGIAFGVAFRAGACPVALHENLLHSFDDVTPAAAMTAELLAYEILTAIKRPRAATIKDPGAMECKSIIDGNFTDPLLDVSHVADLAGIERTALARRFKAAVGLSPSRYLQNKRLNLALRHLERGCTTIEAAGLCGYRDPGYFARAFKRHFGVSPQTWRETVFDRV